MIPVHLLVHVIVQNVAAKASGCSVKRVECEHCGRPYIYQMRRTVTGNAQSYMYMGRGNKKQAAEIAAQGRLQKVLADGLDAVPCPECGKLQAGMIRQVKRATLRVIGFASVFGAIAVGMFWLCTNQFLGGNAFVPAAEIATGVFVGALVLSLIVVWLYDMNGSAYRRTRAAMGPRCRAMPAEEFDALVAAGSASPEEGM